MNEFRIVPFRLDIRGVTYKRGDIIRFDGIFRNGTSRPADYRLWPQHYCVVHKPECFEWFTNKQIEAMQPHWITPQEIFDF